MRKTRIIPFLKPLLFTGILVLLFWLTQTIIIPKWNYPLFQDGTTRCIRGFYALEEDSIDVLTVGTSHMVYGFDAMRLYEDTEITAYDLATSTQSPEMTFFLLQEAFKTQHPRLVIMDASSLFVEKLDTSIRKSMDALVFSVNKLRMARWYAGLYPDEAGALGGAVFPLFRYHDRWKELCSADFDLSGNGIKDFYAKGSYISTQSYPANSAADMNWAANALASDSVFVTEYRDGRSTYQYEGERYSPQIPMEYEAWFIRIHSLCEEQGAQLILIKIPSIHIPSYYKGAWTEQRYAITREFADEHDTPYYDLLYEFDIGLDVSHDFLDGGEHLNSLGAQKATVALEPVIIQYLQGYQLKTSEQYQNSRDAYDKIRRAVSLETAVELESYLKLLNENKDSLSIIIAVRDEARNCLNEGEMSAFRELGMKCDFQNELNFRDSYLSVMDAGRIEWEAVSNRVLEWKGALEDGREITVVSAGWWSRSFASIEIGGEEFARNMRGLNFVVLDRATGNVLDSVCFDTFLSEHPAQRDNAQVERFLREYEMNFL